MSNYNTYFEPSKVVVNRYWKRPKPRVYECNIRDAERFYQESYKDYLKSKEFSASRAQPNHARGIEDEFATKWQQYRANINLDSSLSDPFLRNRREGSLGMYGADGGLESSYRSSMNAYGRPDEEYSRRNGVRASSLMNNRGPSPDAELQSIDDRLDRLKKLREELGLPPEENGIPSASGTGTKSILKDRGAESRVYSSSRGDSRARAIEYPDFDERVQSRTEKSTRFARQVSGGEDKYRPPERLPRENGKFSLPADETLDKYSVRNYMKTDRKPGPENNDFSYKIESKSSRRFGGDDADENSYKYKSESKYSSKNASSYGADDDAYKPQDSKYSRSKYAATEESESKSSRVKSSKKEDVDDLPDYDDDYLNSLKKKFPTSDEIINKISKMDVE